MITSMVMGGHEDQVRAAAFAWLDKATRGGIDPLSSQQIESAREAVGVRLMATQQGIWKPASFGSALSFRTAWRPEGAERPYDDSVGQDELVRYKYRGTDPNHSDNRALRNAMTQRLPLIWFLGVDKAVYQPIYPVYLVGEEPNLRQFIVATAGLESLSPTESVVEETLRRYIRTETERRLHQPIFRSMVMRAYETRCAVCSLRHSELLDAAHIVEDRHERGVAAIRNGIALCKIHHAAYDSRILGVNPDLVVEIRSDILDETDGPLLEHGLKRLHGRPLREIPRKLAHRPDRELLEIRYERFLAV